MDLYRLEDLLLDLSHQTFELVGLEADRMLSISRFFPGHVPVRHPAELFLLCAALQNHEERIERDLFLFFAQPGFKLVRQKCRNHRELAISHPKLEVEIHMQLARSAARGTMCRSSLGEVVEGFEQLVMSWGLLVTLNAVEVLCSHVGPPLPLSGSMESSRHCHFAP